MHPYAILFSEYMTTFEVVYLIDNILQPSKLSDYSPSKDFLFLTHCNTSWESTYKTMFMHPSWSAKVKPKMAASISALIFVPSPIGLAKDITTFPCLYLRIQQTLSLLGVVSALQLVFTLSNGSAGLSNFIMLTLISCTHFSLFWIKYAHLAGQWTWGDVVFNIL